MYPQGVCRIRKPAYAGNGCAIFPIFQTADWGQKIRYPAADDLFRVSLVGSPEVICSASAMLEAGKGSGGSCPCGESGENP